MAEKEEYTKKAVISFDIKDIAKKSMKNLAGQISEAFKNSDIGGNIAKSFSSYLSGGGFFSNLVNNTLKSLDDLIKGSMKELSNILDFSQLSNSETRDLAFKYGFNASQAYGFEKSKELLGFESEEDLFYATDNELKVFRKSFEKYSDYYTNLYDSGFFDTLEEYQFEMKDFKQEMQMEIIDFFMNNKETIKESMKAVMKLSETVVKIFGKVVELFSARNSEKASVSDIVNEYRTNKTSNTNVNVNNTFNGVSKEDSDWISNKIYMNRIQINRALGGVK